jgi:hypothetical protein
MFLGSGGMLRQMDTGYPDWKGFYVDTDQVVAGEASDAMFAIDASTPSPVFNVAFGYLGTGITDGPFQYLGAQCFTLKKHDTIDGTQCEPPPPPPFAPPPPPPQPPHSPQSERCASFNERFYTQLTRRAPDYDVLLSGPYPDATTMSVFARHCHEINTESECEQSVWQYGSRTQWPGYTEYHGLFAPCHYVAYPPNIKPDSYDYDESLAEYGCRAPSRRNWIVAPHYNPTRYYDYYNVWQPVDTTVYPHERNFYGVVSSERYNECTTDDEDALCGLHYCEAIVP